MRKQELHPRTAVVNKEQKNESKKAKNEALIWLAAMFPQAFDNTMRIRPLKSGIMHDILVYEPQAEQAGISKSKLREAVVIFTRRIDYLSCLKAKEMRIDLEGNPITVVTDQEAEAAASKIKKRIEKALRNARKLGQAKPQSSHSTFKSDSNNTASYMQHYQAAVEHSANNNPKMPPNNTRSAAVIIKNKSAKQFDLEAVARLKEKLGLSRRNEQSQESS